MTNKENIYGLKQALNKLQFKYDKFFHNINDAVFVHKIMGNKLGKFIEVNETACKRLGYTRDELLKMTPYDIDSADTDESKRKKLLTKLYKDGNIIFEGKHVTKSGNKIPVEINSRIFEIEGRKYSLSIARDISEKKKVIEQLVQQKQLTQHALNSLSAHIVILDKDGVIQYTNSKWNNFASQNGLDPKMVGPGTNYLKICCRARGDWSEGASQALMGIKKVMRGEKEEFSMEYPCHSPEEKRWFKMKVTPFIGSGPFKAVISHENITQRKMAEEKMRYMSYHDHLTGLYNRNFLTENMKEINKKENLPLSIIMGDINGLKMVNDSIGHKKGDEFIKKTAQAIQENCRKDDIIARWSGDEFVIISFQTSKDGAERIMNRIKNSTQQRKVDSFPLSIALGCAEKKNITEKFSDVFKKAEDNMYKNKLIEGKSMRGHMLSNIMITLGEKSDETEEHCNRMGDLSLKIGEKMGLPTSELDKLVLIASLHDIGKITIPHEILNKRGQLTQQEWQKIKEHPEVGYRILNSTDEFSYISPEVLCHHERWDGEGYPRGLTGKEIPLLARIISIVDAYDVMTHGRPYQKALTPQEALSELKENAGSQFDPEIVETFKDIIKNHYQ